MAFELSDLKKNYAVFEKKYKLPSFKDLNEDFEIEKIEKESDNLLRVIRKTMMEKIVNSLNFLEMLLNPVNAPRIYIVYINGMSIEDKKTIDNIYSSLGDLNLVSLSLEIKYNEKAEADGIKNIFEKWNSVKDDFSRIFSNMNKPVVNNIKREKTYFG